jgi:hypothetical protein
MPGLFSPTRAHEAVQQRGSFRAQPSYRWMILTFTWLALLICFVDRLA